MDEKTSWVAIALRDDYGSWETVRDAPFTPREARVQWDAGLIDMAQKRTGEREFTLLIRVRSARDKNREPFFSAKPADEHKSFRMLSHVRTVGGKRK